MRIGVVGGSIAGCAIAALLLREGHDVTVLERSAGDLEGRGAGIIVPSSHLARLLDLDLVDADMPRIAVVDRRFARCAPDRASAPVIVDVPFPADGGRSLNWSVLWRHLRRRVPDECHRGGWEVREVRTRDDGALELRAPQGTLVVDRVIGADGYRSVVRGWMGVTAAVTGAGYMLWRGTVREGAIPSCAAAVDPARPLTIGFPRGHAVVYPIPADDGATAPGERLLNWAMYDTIADADLERLFGTTDRAVAFRPINPGRLTTVQREYLYALAARELPTFVQDLIEGTPEPFAHPIHDLPAERFATDTMALVGDAGAVGRPHAAGGVGKALNDVFALHELLRDTDGGPAAMAAYDAQRTAAGNELVDIARILGQTLVVAPPDWSTISGPELDALLQAPFDRGLRLAAAPAR